MDTVADTTSEIENNNSSLEPFLCIQSLNWQKTDIVEIDFAPDVRIGVFPDPKFVPIAVIKYYSASLNTKYMLTNSDILAQQGIAGIPEMYDVVYKYDSEKDMLQAWVEICQQSSPL